MSRFGMYLSSRVTIQYDFGTTGKKNLLCLVSFHLFWTDSSTNTNNFHLDVKILIINTVMVKSWLSLFCGYWYVFLSPLLYWFGVFFSPEVELRPYTPAACSLITFWAEYKVEVAVVLVALPGAVRVLPQLLPRSSMSMIHTCPEAPFVRPPLMDAFDLCLLCLCACWSMFSLLYKLS